MIKIIGALMYNGSFQILFTYLEGAIKKHLNVFSLKCLA